MKETEGVGTVVGKRESKCGCKSFPVCTNQEYWLDSASSTKHWWLQVFHQDGGDGGAKQTGTEDLRSRPIRC